MQEYWPKGLAARAAKITRPTKVFIYACTMDMIPTTWAVRTFNPLAYHPQPDFEKHAVYKKGSIAVAQKRNQCVREALKDPKVTHIFSVDHDVIYKDSRDSNQALRFMLGFDLPILAGMMRVRGDGFPCMAYRFDSDGKFRPVASEEFVDRYSLTEVDGIGMGWTLIHRSVFERMEEPWFLEEKLTEDLYFCAKARKLQIPIYIVNDIRLKHMVQMCINPDGSFEPVDS